MLDQRPTHYFSTSICKMYLDTNICFHVGLPISSNIGKLTIPMPRSKSIMVKIYILPLQKSWNSLIGSWTKCGVINVVCLSIIIWRCKWMSIQIRRSTKLCKSASLTLWRGSVAISVRMYYVCETYHAGCILLSSHPLCRSIL